MGSYSAALAPDAEDCKYPEQGNGFPALTASGCIRCHHDITKVKLYNPGSTLIEIIFNWFNTI